MIELEGLWKTFGHGQETAFALRDLSLSVGGGEALALLGPNGAGKSTLVKIISTLLRPSRGQALIAGRDLVTDPAGVRGLIGVTQQEPGLPPAVKVRRLLILHARLLGMDRLTAKRRADELLEFTGLESVAGRQTSQLSAGMQRRLDIGLALIQCPPVLLLDEPTSCLDPHARGIFWAEFARLRDQGVCVLLVSQDLEEIEYLADRVALLKGGMLLRDNIAATEARDVWGDGETAFAC